MTYKVKTTQDKVDKGLALIKQKGEVSGSRFSISGIEGAYSFDGETLKIQITDAPWYVMRGTIEEEINKFFA